MSDELPSGDRSVYLFLDMIAFSFVLEGVAALVRGQESKIWLGSFAAAIVFFVVGIKWSRITTAIGWHNRNKAQKVAATLAVTFLAALGLAVWFPRERKGLVPFINSFSGALFNNGIAQIPILQMVATVANNGEPTSVLTYQFKAHFKQPDKTVEFWLLQISTPMHITYSGTTGYVDILPEESLVFRTMKPIPTHSQVQGRLVFQIPADALALGQKDMAEYIELSAMDESKRVYNSGHIKLSDEPNHPPLSVPGLEGQSTPLFIPKKEGKP